MGQRQVRDRIIFRRRIRQSLDLKKRKVPWLLLLILGTTIIPVPSFVLPYHPGLSARARQSRDLEQSRPRWSSKQETVEQGEGGKEREGDLIDILEELERAEATQTRTSPDAPICRIVSRADSEFPTSKSTLPSELFQEPYLLEKLDAYYNAQAYRYTKSLTYLQRRSEASDDGISSEDAAGRGEDRDIEEEDEHLVALVRSSLEDAGFKPLSRRDLDLCNALNVGYLLRLSIAADLSQLDPGIADEFYPELRRDNSGGEEILFGGRCLVFWRGYSREVTTGRLVLPKLDYLQTSLVRRSATWVKKQLDEVEGRFFDRADRQSKKIKNKIQDIKETVLPVGLLSEKEVDDGADATSTNGDDNRKGVNLGRYGGGALRFVGTPDPDGVLDPFVMREIRDFGGADDDAAAADGTGGVPMAADSPGRTPAAERDLRAKLNRRGCSCEYDEQAGGSLRSMAGAPRDGGSRASRVRLLERVSISNLVNIFTRYGRRSLISTLFAKSKLVEPTYKEVVVVWKPLEKKSKRLYPPKIVSDLADIFDVDGFEQPPKRKKQSSTGNLEIRNFQGVPMSNIQAVFPETKLVFRPADALLFDTVSLVTFALVLGSIRLDSPGLDLLALISVGLWIFRTVIRYSNKLARYDLLVKNFLTSKISHRNEGALKYLAQEAGLQRAIRASMVLSWLEVRFREGSDEEEETDDDVAPNGSPMNDAYLQSACIDGVNEALDMEAEVEIDIGRALKDLGDLDLVSFSPETGFLSEVATKTESANRIERAWSTLLLDRNAGRFRKEKKEEDEQTTEERKSDIANIIASNLLTNLGDSKEPIQKAIKAAQEKGYTKVKEILQDEDNRRRLEAALKKAKEKGYSGYTKVKEIIKDKKSVAIFEEALLNRKTRESDDKNSEDRSV